MPTSGARRTFHFCLSSCSTNPPISPTMSPGTRLQFSPPTSLSMKQQWMHRELHGWLVATLPTWLHPTRALLQPWYICFSGIMTKSRAAGPGQTWQTSKSLSLLLRTCFGRIPEQERKRKRREFGRTLLSILITKWWLTITKYPTHGISVSQSPAGSLASYAYMWWNPLSLGGDSSWLQSLQLF